MTVLVALGTLAGVIQRFFLGRPRPRFCGTSIISFPLSRHPTQIHPHHRACRLIFAERVEGEISAHQGARGINGKLSFKSLIFKVDSGFPSAIAN